MACSAFVLLSQTSYDIGYILHAVLMRSDIPKAFIINFRYLRNDRTTILMNLCVSLFFAYIVFLAGIDRTESKVSYNRIIMVS